MMGRLLVAVLAISLVAGCAVPRELTREEFLRATKREYRDVDKEKILSAAEKIFRLSDGGDYKFSFTEDGMQASRFYNVFLLLSTAQGNFVWNIETKTNDGAVEVKALVEDRAGGFLAPTYTRVYNTPATYDLFFRRLDYMLGISSEWLTCQQATELYRNNVETWGHIDPWCWVTKDDAPEI